MSRPAPAEEVGSRRRRRGTTAPRSRHGERGERGAVTAETVVVLPLLVAVALGLVWALALATTQVRVVDAARETARAAARGETRPTATALGRRVAPAGSTVTVSEASSTVVVQVRTLVQAPGGLLSFLPSVPVHAEAVAALEEG